MLEKTTRMNYLYDFYQSLLTPKQRDYMSLYYRDDFSLGEIAENHGVSRQAVYDNLKRTEALLEEYEEKLSLYKRFEERKKLLVLIRQELTESPLDKGKLNRYLDHLEELD
ncbi:putative DNA-binding protein [Siminovitchia sediminis]|uniref:UPF0122 protein ACFSCZ_03700 n=1 Tax=Siminovitchia sediminis TaxID=1274353 RepID=A0ABW4KCD3_9BACI